MSTTFDLRNGPLISTRQAPEASPPRRRDGSARGVRERTPVRVRPAAANHRVAASRLLVRWPASLRLPFLGRWRLRGAGLFGVATLVLSLLGLIYLVQISHVARYGYMLADVQSRQAEVERQNQLLIYRLSEEQGLARASDVARREYGMRPFDRQPTVVSTGGTGSADNSSVAQPAASATGASSSKSPRHRFITVQRPLPVEPTPQLALQERNGILDLLWNRLVGIGTARST